ncbi:MAG: AbrB/MazE/SpoVT family DNA-binding domain-containing protein [Candidatus Rokuibacteriota bacterium]
MRTTIDQDGRLAIPKEIRREAGLKPGMPLDIRLREGRIEIEVAPLPVRLVRKGRLLVAVAGAKVPALTSETVKRACEDLRRSRTRRV